MEAGGVLLGSSQLEAACSAGIMHRCVNLNVVKAFLLTFLLRVRMCDKVRYRPWSACNENTDTCPRKHDLIWKQGLDSLAEQYTSKAVQAAKYS